jgi:dolichyldiphosphatase
MTKKAFSLTYVTYDDGDVVGFLAAGVTLAPIFIMVMYASLILFRREFHTLAMLVGQLINEISSVVLKEITEHSFPELAKRPEGKPRTDTYTSRVLCFALSASDKTDSGMPSSHAQFMFFFATYVTLFMANRYVLYLPNPL